MKEILTQKIRTNEELLQKMIQKKENLEAQIRVLERKIENQKHALNNLPPTKEETIVPVESAESAEIEEVSSSGN